MSNIKTRTAAQIESVIAGVDAGHQRMILDS